MSAAPLASEALGDMDDTGVIGAGMGIGLTMSAELSIPIRHALWSDSRNVIIAVGYVDVAIATTRV